MTSSIDSYFLPSYEISCREFFTPAALIGCIGLPWAERHWQLANTDTTYSLGHRVIACLEALPVIGALIVLIERIIARYWQLASTDGMIVDREYLFLARQAGRSQQGCCGDISVERADEVRQKLQERAGPGILFDAAIYQRCPSIKGTCTAMSLEFASTYFQLRAASMELESDESILDKLCLVSGNFETSSEEMRSRQAAYSSITVDRTVHMDVSRNKIESCVKYHDFAIDYCSEEMDITTDVGLLQQEIDSLTHGVYFIRMLHPMDNHKLEARGHSMIYVHEEGMRLFYDNNCGLEKIATTSCKADGVRLCERLLHVHGQWDIPIIRFYRLKPETGF